MCFWYYITYLLCTIASVLPWHKQHHTRNNPTLVIEHLSLRTPMTEVCKLETGSLQNKSFTENNIYYIISIYFFCKFHVICTCGLPQGFWMYTCAHCQRVIYGAAQSTLYIHHNKRTNISEVGEQSVKEVNKTQYTLFKIYFWNK